MPDIPRGQDDAALTSTERWTVLLVLLNVVCVRENLEIPKYVLPMFYIWLYTFLSALWVEISLSINLHVSKKKKEKTVLINYNMKLFVPSVFVMFSL